MNDISHITTIMNLPLKPPKYKTLSICAGRSKEIPFTINDNVLTYVKDKPEKFLGSWIMYEQADESVPGMKEQQRQLIPLYMTKLC